MSKSKRQIRYSIIIPTYNNWNAIRQVVGGVMTEVQAARDTEVIVVDSSDDGTTAKLQNEFPEIVLVNPPHRILQGPARFLGASKASGDILILLDGDCLPDKGWLNAFRAAQADLKSGIVCGAVDLNEPFDLSQLTEYIFWKLPENSSVPRGRYGFVISENMMIRKDDFVRMGELEAVEFGSDAVMDVARRKAGLTVIFEPAARVFHIHPRGWGLHIRKLHRTGIGTFPQIYGLKGYKFGRWMAVLFPIVFLVRWLRITWRILRYRPQWVGRYLLVQPMLWVALLAYQAGLWRGLFRMFLSR